MAEELEQVLVALRQGPEGSGVLPFTENPGAEVIGVFDRRHT